MIKTQTLFKNLINKSLTNQKFLRFFTLKANLELNCADIKTDKYLIKQLPTSCLSHYAYYIESAKESAIVDPMRDVEPYRKIIKERQTKLKYILETHFHADYVSGHHDLAKGEGAKIVYGPNAAPEFDILLAKDGEDLKLGDMKIRVLHTPGHTLESTCYLLLDENDKQIAVFTGDTLFLNEVGRPDLAVKQGSITEKDLASMQFDSIRAKLGGLDDDVRVYPGHGAGSACGKKIGSGSYCTIGNQKQTNYVFDSKLSKEDYIKITTTGLQQPPRYFFHDAKLNQMNINSIDDILQIGQTPLSPQKVEELMKEPDVVVLDTRDTPLALKCFVKGSVLITLKGNFATFVTKMFGPDQKFIIVAQDNESIKETIERLARIGYENVLGYPEGGIEAIKQNNPKDVISPEIADLTKAKELIESGNYVLLDVRDPNEWEQTGVIKNSFLKPYYELNHLDVDKSANIGVYCRMGPRAALAASQLIKQGYKHVTFFGGILKLNELGVNLQKYNKV